MSAAEDAIRRRKCYRCRWDRFCLAHRSILKPRAFLSGASRVLGITGESNRDRPNTVEESLLRAVRDIHAASISVVSPADQENQK